MRKIRLLGIAPYEGMYRLMSNLSAQRSDVELTVFKGNLTEALEIMQKNKELNIDAIISRGGTAEILRKTVDIPVYDITPSVYDIFRTIMLAQEMGEPFAVVGYPTISKHSEILCEIMQYDCEVFTIHNENDCDIVLQQLKDKGIKVIVGDTISVQYCKSYGLQGLLIVSGMESVDRTIDNAVEMYKHFDSLARQATLLSDMLADSEGSVLIFKSDGCEVFRSDNEIPDDISASLRQKIPNVITQRSLKLTSRYGNIFFTVSGRRLISMNEEYCVFTIRSSSATAAAVDKYRIRFLNADTELPGSHPLDFYLGNGSYGENLRGICKRYADMNSPVLMMGPRGTGKGRIAHYIYSLSHLKHSSLIWIDVSELTEKGWSFLLDSESSPLLDTGLTIFFRNVNNLDNEHIHLLLAYLRNSGSTHVNRLMFSFDSQESGSVSDELYFYLAEELHCAQLHTVALSKRIQDIQSLTGLCINTFNVHFGTQVVGLSQGALLSIQSQPWPRNVDQLVHFMSLLVAGSDSAYISEEDVQNLLAAEKRESRYEEKKTIDLNGTLNEINREIVRQIYLAEGMNQTRTANRLGISRSTIWRILKE